MVNKIVQSSELIVDRKKVKMCVIKHLVCLGFFIINCQLLTVNYLYGYSFLGVDNYGDPVSGYTARSIGMGSTDITAANDSAALASNPAALLNVTAKKLVLSVSPVYNVFEERANVANINMEYTKLKLNDMGAASYLYYGSSEYFNRIIAGIHFHPMTDLSYQYSNKEYSDVPALVSVENLDSSGGINELDFGVGAEIIKEVYFGLTYGVLSGENSLKDNYTTYTNNGTTDQIYVFDATRKFEGSCMRYGLVLTEWDYSLGMFYQPQASLTAKTSGTNSKYNVTVANAWSTSDLASEKEINLPEKFGFGFSYRFKDKYRTLFAADFVQQNWNAFTSATTSVAGVATGNKKQHTTGYDGTKEIKIGFQHWLNDWIPVRYGFRYQQFYQTWDNNVNNFYYGVNILKKEVPTFSCISLGSGYVLGYFDFDFGYEFGRRNYTDISSERYDEYLQKFALTARYRW